MAVSANKIDIRKALEAPIQDLAATLNIPAVMGGLNFDTTTAAEFLRTSIVYGKDLRPEIGVDSRLQRSGTFTVDVFTPLANGDDYNDERCALVRNAYPYGQDLERNGIRVNILGIDDGQCIDFRSWKFAPVDVRFIIWEA